MHSSSNGSPHVVKKVQKNFKNNYASVECGAKILSANTEAKVLGRLLLLVRVLLSSGPFI